jgi:SAM-dependent methyltransferase
VGARYDDQFFAWVDRTADRSARRVVPLVQGWVGPRSVADVGCGRGAWLAVWREAGAERIVGYDGDYVDRERLRVDRDQFRAVDLRDPPPIEERFDLAQSLEVAEHLEPDAAPRLVAFLCGLADVVLFSAAPPGQGGEGHVHEREPSYWAGLFAARGYAAFDALRPVLAGDPDVDPWYKYNSLLYASAAGQERLPDEVLSARVLDVSRLEAGGDLAWRARRAILRPLPVSVVTWLSRVHGRIRARGSG